MKVTAKSPADHISSCPSLHKRKLRDLEDLSVGTASVRALLRVGCLHIDSEDITYQLVMNISMADLHIMPVVHRDGNPSLRHSSARSRIM